MQISQIAPKFLWLLRDFALELEQDGRVMSENEYMESKLASFSNSSKEINRKTRDAIVKYFNQRELITMVRPVEDE